MTIRASLLIAFATALLALPAPSSAQPFRPMFDSIQLSAPDPEKAASWYRARFGGQILAEGRDRVLYGDTRIIFQKRDASLPSEGTAIDHIGFSVPNVDGAMKAFHTDGVKITQAVRDVPGLFKLGFIEDPWGTRIEVVQDSQKLGLHHVHLRAPDPAETLAWFAQQFGGRAGKMRDRLDGLELTGVWLLVQKGEAAPSAGHAIDHIGFRATNLESAITAMKGRNVKITTEPRSIALAGGRTIQHAFVEGPHGVSIELAQRPE